MDARAGGAEDKERSLHTSVNRDMNGVNEVFKGSTFDIIRFSS